jgi:uncharacterized protein (TIGR00255 family)
MTGFASRTFQFGEESYKIEVKSLNHRFLDLKLRIPRDFAVYDSVLRSWIEAKVKRGAIDFWIERQGGLKVESEYRLDDARAKSAYQILTRLKTEFGIRDEVTLRDLISFPEVLSKSGTDGRDPEQQELLKKELHLTVGLVLEDLTAMKRSEGERLKEALLGIIRSFKEAHAKLLNQRKVIELRAREKIKRRIETCFEAFPVADERMRALMENRVAQEISYSLEKLDVEEELTRFMGHIQAVEQLLHAGGATGKKLDFIFQELNREVNTLANKSQDLEMSADVIELKIGIEQLREQSLNLE